LNLAIRRPVCDDVKRSIFPASCGVADLWYIARMRRVLCGLVCASLTSCSVAPAPAGFEESSRWLFANGQESPVELVADAVLKVDAEIGELVLERGELKAAVETKLTLEDIAPVNLPDNDPSKAHGMVYVSKIGCTLDAFEAVQVATNQDEIHGGYDAYARVYDSDSAAYFARTTPFLTWNTDYTLTVPVFGYQYKAAIRGGVRRLTPGGEFPFGSVVVGRAWLKRPAEYLTGADDSAFNQDYQLDLFYERAPGVTIHAFVVWRDMHYGDTGSDSDVFQTLVLNGSADADDRIEARCKP